MKVMTMLGTRPEIIKLSLTLNELDKHFDHVIVHTGQNFDYELNEVFFEDFGLRRPDYFLGAVVGGGVAQTIGNIIIRADEVMEQEKPDALLLYGDTNSCLSIIVAKRRKIPVFHMEAGNRCFDQRVPEELNRKVVDHLSDINLVLTEHARRYLISEGIRAETIIKVGSSMKEVLHKFGPDIEKSTILSRLRLTATGYFVVSAHREENVDDSHNLERIVAAVNDIAREYDAPIIVSTHPRTRKRLDSLNCLAVDNRVVFSKPFGFFDYICLQKNAKCVLSDSGTITEEASILGFPAVTIRNTHERPEGMDESVVVMSGLNPEKVLQAIRMVVAQHEYGKVKLVADYDVDNVSIKIPRIIMSYTDYVNRTVWSKETKNEKK